MLDPVHLFRILHGQLGLAAAIALLHPVFTLRRGRAPLSTTLSTILALTTVVGGWLLYPGYRAVEKPRLLQHAFGVAMAFETKEHLGFFVAVLAIAGLALARSGARPQARAAYGLASALAFATGALGAWVAATTTRVD